MSKRRKVDAECRVVQEKWITSYLFTKVSGKQVCLVCSQHISVLKEYSLKCHYQANQAENYNNFQRQRRAEKKRVAHQVEETTVFIRSREVSDAAMKASYIIADEIFRRQLCEDLHAEGGRNCVSQKKRQAFANKETA